MESRLSFFCSSTPSGTVEFSDSMCCSSRLSTQAVYQRPGQGARARPTWHPTAAGEPLDARRAPFGSRAGRSKALWSSHRALGPIGPRLNHGKPMKYGRRHTKCLKIHEKSTVFKRVQPLKVEIDWFLHLGTLMADPPGGFLRAAA